MPAPLPGGPPGSIGRGGAPVKANPNDWRVQILDMIHAPVTDSNLTALQAWALSESGYNSTYGTNMAGPGYFNPLAITDGYGVPSVRSINSDGVLAFPNTQAGVTATVRFWQHGYTDIITALRNSDPVALYQAVNQSGWCSGCQSGHYPVDLYGYLSGGSVQGGSGTFHGGGPNVAGGSPGSGGSGGSGGPSQDGGGLYGSCHVSTSSIPLASFSVPTGGFGCYVEKTLIFGGLSIGGALLMLVGGALIVLPAIAGGASRLSGAWAPVAEGLAVGSSVGKRLGLQSPPAATPAVKTLPSLSEQREKRQQERHRATLRKNRADARTAEAKAREAELRAPTNRQRVAAAGKGETKAAGPVGSGPAKLAYEVPGV